MCLLIHSNVIRSIFVYCCIFLTVMGRTKRPAALLLVLGTLLTIVSTSEGSNSTKPQGQGIPLNNFVINQIAQNILTDPNALDNYLQQFLPTIMKSLPKPASSSTTSSMSALLQKILIDMAGLYTNQTQPTDDIGLAEAQLVEMLRESMKNPVVRGIVVQMAKTLITEVTLDCQLRPGHEVIKLDSNQSTMVGCLRTHVRKQPIMAPYFESETVLKFYNLEAWSPGYNLLISTEHEISTAHNLKYRQMKKFLL